MAHNRRSFCNTGYNRSILAHTSGHLIYRNRIIVLVQGISTDPFKENGIKAKVSKARIKTHVSGG